MNKKLPKAKRKLWLHKLGYTYTAEGIKKFQKKYLTRSKCVTGKWNYPTDRAMRTVINCNGTHFDALEFRCECRGKHCSGYPVVMKRKEILLANQIRNHYKVPMTITCGIRCKGYNAELNGSVTTSKHLQGKAIDCFVPNHTDTLARRKAFIDYAIKEGASFAYGDGVRSDTSRYVAAPYMGNAVHFEVK